MKVSREVELKNFEFWGGAVANAKAFTDEEMDILESILDDFSSDDGHDISETQLNDIFWFEPETLCEWLGIDFEEWENRA